MCVGKERQSGESSKRPAETNVRYKETIGEHSAMLRELKL